jgi:hypothetical protein
MDVPVIPLANNYLQKTGVTLAAVAAAFAQLEPADKRKVFGMLCIRKGESGERLTDLLFALAKHLQSAQPATFALMEQSWTKELRQLGVEETLRVAFCEHRFQ